MKYRHYAPSAPLTLLRGPHKDVSDLMKNMLSSDPDTGVICYESDKKRIYGKNVVYLPDDRSSQAKELFSLLRGFEGRNAGHIYSVIPTRAGVGLAVCNRLIKAAGYDIKHVGITIPVIGLTGQSGAGKSTAARYFAESGASLCDCDAIYHELLYSGSPLSKKIEKHFPGTSRGGVPDRKLLSAVVFSDRKKLDLLNSVTHGAILDEVRKRIKRAEKDGASFAVVDASQLFEAGYDSECTAVVGVCAPFDVRLARITERDGISEDDAKARLENQHNEDFFRVYCDEVIENAGRPEEMKKKVAEVTGKYVLVK